MLHLTLLATSSATPTVSSATPKVLPTVLIAESGEFAASLKAELKTSWNVVHCSGNCTSHDASSVIAVVGRASALDLASLVSLKLVQGASYFHTDGGAVPAHAAICNTAGFWPAQGVDQIAEWAIAALFNNQYQLGASGAAFRACAFESDAPSGCASASAATNHTMVSDLTIGILGFGRIGTRVAQMAAAVGSTVVATKRHGPFVPPPKPLKWISSDNDRLYREADVIVITVPGTGHKETQGMINATSLSLMKPNAIIIPVSAGPINFSDLEAALRARPSMTAVIDVWPQGCWHYPNVTCGAPLGEKNWPASPTLGALPNVLPLPGASMRDARFWDWSVTFAARNLDALSRGEPLQGVVRNATDEK